MNLMSTSLLFPQQEGKRKTQILVKEQKIGDTTPFVIAGPCSIQSYEQLKNAAKIAKQFGAQALRGGAFKPRTSPYAFQGLKQEGLEILKEVGKELDLITVSEVIDCRDIEAVFNYADILQVGSRNMHNSSLLKELGMLKKPILLKRGFAATYEEFLLAAEYILSGGNQEVILCERGIRTFETYTRNTLDLNAVAALKELSHLPIIVDPSHGTGKRSLVLPMARAAIAAGADGLIVEMQMHPETSISDAMQTIGPKEFQTMMEEILKVHNALFSDGLKKNQNSSS